MTTATAPLEIVELERLSGIAKKIGKELEDLPLQTHATVIHMLQGFLNHRQLNLQMLQQQAKQEMQDKQMEMAIAEQKRQEAERFRRESGIEVVRA